MIKRNNSCSEFREIALKIVVLTILITAISCKSTSDKSEQEASYDYEVLYRFQGDKMNAEDKYRAELSNDTVYFILESEFKRNHLMIKSDKVSIFSEDVSTEPSSGIANVVHVGKNLISDEISIQIDNGPNIRIDFINRDYNIIGIRHHNSKVSIVFYKSVPKFY